MSQYPEDEFDIAGRERSPEGVHREVRPLWRTLLPYVLVIVIVPLLAFGAFQLVQGGSGDDEPSAAPSEATPAEPSEEPSDETEPPDDEEPSEEPEEETTEPEPEESENGLDEDVDETTTVSVLNGSGVDGLAAQAASQLGEAGFTSVSAGDYGSGSPEVTTLYYRNSDLEATAQAVADELGISAITEAASATENVEIAIVLRSDFDG